MKKNKKNKKFAFMEVFSLESTLDSISDIDNAIEMHKRSKQKHSWLDERIPGVVNFLDVYGNTEADTSRRLCVCQQCNSKVGVTRFAMHLETCSSRRARGGREAEPIVEEIIAVEMKKTRKRKKEHAKEVPTRLVQKDDLFRCGVCYEEAHIKPMALCDSCDRGYHMECLKRLAKGDPSEVWRQVYNPTSPWLCIECAPNCLDRTNKESENYFGQTAHDKLKLGRQFAPCDFLEFFCDCCNERIYGKRWRCLLCNNMDLCVKCRNRKLPPKNPIDSKGRKQLHTHSMILMKIPKLN